MTQSAEEEEEGRRAVEVRTQALAGGGIAVRRRGGLAVEARGRRRLGSLRRLGRRSVHEDLGRADQTHRRRRGAEAPHAAHDDRAILIVVRRYHLVLALNLRRPRERNVSPL